MKLSSLHELNKLESVVGRAIDHLMEENDLNQLSFTLVLDHQYSKKSLETNKRGRDHLLHECITEAMKSTECYVSCSEITLNTFQRPESKQSYDDVKLEEVELNDEQVWHIEPENQIWLNRNHFIEMELQHFQYTYWTGNEGMAKGLGYHTFAIQILKDYEY